MEVELITREDLHKFRIELLNSIKAIITHQAGYTEKQWLKSNEVRKLLKISSGTLQNLRINGTLTYTKVGSIIFYAYDDIQKVLEKNKINNSL